MFDVIKNVIETGGFDLERMLRKIDVYHLEDNLTDEQRAALITLARQRANPYATYAGWQTEAEALSASVRALSNALDALTKRVAALENGKPAAPAEPETPPSEQNSNGTPVWSEYAPPTGAHNAYNVGDKVTFREKRYISKRDANVWSPWAYPDYWQLVD